MKQTNKIKIKCSCNQEFQLSSKSYYNWIKRNNAIYGTYICQSCKTKKMWENKEYRDKITEKSKRFCNSSKGKELASQRAKNLWNNEDKKNKLVSKLKIITNTDEYKNRKSAISKRICNSENYKKKMSEKMKILCSQKEHIDEMSRRAKKLWNTNEYREKMYSIFSSNEYKEKIAITRSNQPRCSSIQEILYSILNDLNVKYYREYPDRPADKETTIGPYNFDCVIPRDNKPALLIECQGDYWHSLENKVRIDRAKASYIENNFSKEYELKYLWEHEFKCENKIVDLIKYWLGITDIELVQYDFKNIIIKECVAKDYKLLLSKYHYLPNAGRGGIAYGAYLDDELIAVCVFSPLIRQNINIAGYSKNEVRELSRLCIHPNYQKKNLASWFISRCIKLLPNKYKCVISYCDTTFNHDGAVYKACNFKQDSIIRPDFWYVDRNGWAMHKKTLYGHAKLCKMTASEFASKNGYIKVYGKEKFRFIYNIK